MLEPDHECLRRLILHSAEMPLRNQRPDLRVSLFRAFMCPGAKVLAVLEMLEVVA